MKRKHSILCLIILLFSVGIARGETVSTSTAEDQVGMQVTVYNSNIGLVKDTRKIVLPRGTGELRFMDVAARIRPATVDVKSTTDPKSFAVLEQNYEYDLMNSKKLLDKYVGKKIKIIDVNKYQDRKDVIEATLLSNNQGRIFKINDEIYLGHPGYKVLPKIPENLIAKPTLTWLCRNDLKKPQIVQVSYLTRSINWKADYVVVLDGKDVRADVSGWVTLDNKSGATYKNADLKLVAGDVHVAEESRLRYAVSKARAPVADADDFKAKAFFEYHIYTLQRKTTVKDKQTKQVRLITASGAKVEKELLVYGIRSFFTRLYRDRNPKQPVNVYVKFKNSKDNNLGMPLPAGVMRLYKQDQDGSRQFIGEDKIDHTPKDEEVKLKIGKAFDVVAERRQTDYKRMTSRLHESAWEITLRNHKDQEVAVGIVEPLYGHWKVIEKNHPFKKMDAFTIRFDVKVPKNGEVKVKYRVRVGF